MHVNIYTCEHIYVNMNVHYTYEYLYMIDEYSM